MGEVCGARKSPNSFSMVVQVLYEDNHLIAVLKPPGMSTQEDLLPLVKEWLKKKYQKPGNVFVGVIHRLDKPVSGVVLFAKTSKGASRISSQIRGRRVKKLYLARVIQPPTQTGEIHLGWRWDEEKKRAIIEPLSTPGTVEVAINLKEKAPHLLEIELLTGKKHQIRAMLASLKAPILGDGPYGGAAWDTEGIALFASKLGFFHPTEPEKWIEIEPPSPNWGRE